MARPPPGAGLRGSWVATHSMWVWRARQLGSGGCWDPWGDVDGPVDGCGEVLAQVVGLGPCQAVCARLPPVL